MNGDSQGPMVINIMPHLVCVQLSVHVHLSYNIPRPWFKDRHKTKLNGRWVSYRPLSLLLSSVQVLLSEVPEDSSVVVGVASHDQDGRQSSITTTTYGVHHSQQQQQQQPTHTTSNTHINQYRLVSNQQNALL